MLKLKTNFFGTRGSAVVLKRKKQQEKALLPCSMKTPFLRWQIVVLFFCVFNVCNAGAAEDHGDWIDPDTPSEARSTSSYTLHIPPKPTHAPTILYDDDYYFDDDSLLKSGKNGTKKGVPKRIKPTKKPTQQPTSAPTSPTGAPSSAPSSTEGAYKLVFSDEFNTPGRTFGDGNDPRWTALDKNDYTNNALHYYSPANAYTNEEGELVIKTEAADTDVVGYNDVKRKKEHVTKHFRSAMLQSWNKFCFTGGIVEAEVVLPGKSEIGGLWPAFWMLGNLARHTYVGSSEHIWPWSQLNCTKKSAVSQKITACHKVAHYGMEAGVGRGAPEIDIFEVQPGNVAAHTGVFHEMTVGQPFMSSSYQIAPGKSAVRPGNGFWPGPGQWYDGLIGGVNTSLNVQFYGSYNHFRGDYDPATSDYWSDAISFNRQLNEDHFAKRHIYRLEWEIPTDDRYGHLNWYLDGILVFSLNGKSLADAGLGGVVSTEPSYILFNTAVSSEWGFPKTCPANCPCKHYDCQSSAFSDTCGFSEGFCDMIKQAEPPEMKVNWVRVYQDPRDPLQKVGCSTPERPTRRWIEANAEMYKQDKDATPLKSVQTGRGSCDPKASGSGMTPLACGGDVRGRCTSGHVCECNPGWTGPHCLAHSGRDPIDWDAPDSIADVGFEPPVADTSRFLATVLGVLAAGFILLVRWKKSMDGWVPLPDAEKSGF